MSSRKCFFVSTELLVGKARTDGFGKELVLETVLTFSGDTDELDVVNIEAVVHVVIVEEEVTMSLAEFGNEVMDELVKPVILSLLLESLLEIEFEVLEFVLLSKKL